MILCQSIDLLWPQEFLIKFQNFTFLLGKERYLFAVFDGHGGNQVAEYVRDHFINLLTKNSNFIDEHYEVALTETFTAIDVDLRGKEGDELMK